MIGEEAATAGKKRSSTICWPDTCSVSLRKMSGMADGFSAA